MRCVVVVVFVIGIVVGLLDVVVVIVVVVCLLDAVVVVVVDILVLVVAAFHAHCPGNLRLAELLEFHDAAVVPIDVLFRVPSRQPRDPIFHQLNCWSRARVKQTQTTVAYVYSSTFDFKSQKNRVRMECIHSFAFKQIRIASL